MYQPAILIVGTRGRSLGGIQGLVNARNSFSKYCLQYSPIPVVVVRPTGQRMKKKAKRHKDATRQTYVAMLAAADGRHEADNPATGTYELEVQNSPDEEAHQVAKVLGLPARFDPTIKPLSPSLLRPRSRPTSPHPGAESTGARAGVTRLAGQGGGESEEEEEEEEDGDFEVIDGRQALQKQQRLEQLHKMEVGEAAALKKRIDDEDDDEEEEVQEAKGAS